MIHTKEIKRSGKTRTQHILDSELGNKEERREFDKKGCLHVV